MKKITFVFTSGRKNILPDVLARQAPSEFFYGAPELAERGYAINYLEYLDFGYDDKPRKSLFFRKKKLSDVLAQPRNLTLLNQADMIVATTTSYSTALAELCRAKKLTTPVISIAMGILELSADEASKTRARTVFEHTLPVSTSKSETCYFREQFPARAKIIAYMTFGVDSGFWRPDAKPLNNPPYVLSIGNDQHRDYELLVRAWKPQYPLLKIITKRKIAAPIPSNIEILAGDWRKKFFSDDEIRTLMRESLFGVFPIRETIQPSGQSACLQMMACGKAVIISKMKGLWDEEGMLGGTACLLPTPGSAKELQVCVENLMSDPTKAASLGKAARRVVEERFTTAIMADDLERLIL